MRIMLTGLVWLNVFAVATHADILVADGRFADWALEDSGIATVVVEPDGGNPGARVSITTTSTGGKAMGFAVKNDLSTDLALEGLSADFSIGVKSGPGAFGSGQAIGLLVEQGGVMYRKTLGLTGFPRDWDPVGFTTTLNGADFIAGALTADLGGGVDTRFGFFAFNTLSPQLTNHYDNFELVIRGIDIPEPASTALLCPSMIAIVGRLRPRRRPDRQVGDTGGRAQSGSAHAAPHPVCAATGRHASRSPRA